MHTGLWTKKLHNIKTKNWKSWRFSIQNLGFLFCTNLKNFACLLFLFISTFSIGTTWTFILWMVRFETICWRFPSFSILCSNLDTIFWIWTQYTCLVCLNINVFLYDLSKVCMLRKYLFDLGGNFKRGICARTGVVKENKWVVWKRYFVTKIVLTYCEKKMF